MNSRYLKLLSLKKFKKQVCLAVLVCLLLSIAILHTRWSLFTDENVSCHYTAVEDSLPLFVDLSSPVTIFQFLGYEKVDQREDRDRRYIFFHETSCRGDLTPRQACAIESAARAHPNWTVIVLFSSSVSARAGRAGGLRRLILPNVKYARVKLPDYVMGTPLQDIVLQGKLNSSSYPHSHTSDVLRYTTLYKHPGVYLDLDVVVARSIDELGGSFVVRESDHAVAAAVIAFDDGEVGRSVARAVAWEMKETFRGDEFGHNGPGVITRVLARRCGTDDPSAMNAFMCQGLKVYGPELAYPIPWHEAYKYFSDAGSQPVLADSSHSQPLLPARLFHVWGRFSSHYSAHAGSLYHHLTRKYCPTIYAAFPQEFGR
ncbi:lactosylceramide 4-alpha-galactosyltransferase-like [Pectinophora gossypiella]|uniref:lactosylceramide 4-alpha-galactosyltransferase-like n=1 Tax=Pectinophora gossypiella TaxID=13191 RepID=UPI00214F2200|nr:lactosylceramide 4-alpha-galactosyltransferase-like [Pectinophora gossypiella]XP_049882793.1 lactosylceramide 4-alpha-galactosyltransferase-like [Pectinophora gossypiella]XP_049882794.1 lactosylceramide 4-alpha-galactosyltransferase-like [Pectinophora gossypiella]XP_049882795.1 lactosylceramide 4-alpha-galactosyltransferase-like [Pectinophora gossypiella]